LSFPSELPSIVAGTGAKRVDREKVFPIANQQARRVGHALERMESDHRDVLAG
jgi:hypothetical protein